MNNLKISTRLRILLGALSALLVAIGSIGLFGISQSNAALKTVYEDRTVAIEKLAEVNYLLLRNRVLIMDMMINPDAANVQKRDSELRGNVEKTNKLLETYLSTKLQPEEKKLADEFVSLRKRYALEGLVPAGDALRAGQADEAAKFTKKRSA